MQTLRKKNSPCKFKNEQNRFLGEGVSFKAKLIGILEVPEARGDIMCQKALEDLKTVIRVAGTHKQRIAVQVSIDGLRLRDEGTGECLYHHPVHKISFIAQDMKDMRAFGYIFGSPDTGHRFFGIKTKLPAKEVVIAIRDLFQVVFEQKKKEIELAKEHIEQNSMNAIKLHTTGMCVEPAPDTKGATDLMIHRSWHTTSEVEKSTDKKESHDGVTADLLGLQSELNSLQQGIHQIDKITPENPPQSSDDLFETDPFGDSFANMKLKETVRPILPPPPSSKRSHLERQQTVPAPSTTATFSPATTLTSKTPPPQSTIHWFDKETENLFSENELENLAKDTSTKTEEDNSLNVTPQVEQSKSPQIDVFTELDPLGTGLIKPYIDKKDFFQHLKNPPKKVLKDLVSTSSTDTTPKKFNITTEPLDAVKIQSDLSLKTSDRFEEPNFANFDKVDEKTESFAPVPRPESPKKDVTLRSAHHQPLSVSLPPEETTVASKVTSTSTTSSASILSRMDRDSTESIQAMVKLPSPKKYLQPVRKRNFDIDLHTGRAQSIEKSFPVDFTATSDSPASPLRSCSSGANSRLSSSSAEMDLVPEPPPRGAGSILINPPPLPPKKQSGWGGMRPPLRPPHTEGHSHYAFLEREKVSPSPTRKNRSPPKETKGQFDDNFTPPLQMGGESNFMETMSTSASEDSFSSMVPTTTLSSFFTSTSTPVEAKKTKPPLDITLSQLTSSKLDDLASSLGMTVQQLTSLTLQQLTECLASLSAKETTEAESAPPKQEPEPPAEKSEQLKEAAEATHFVSSEPLFKTNFDQEQKQDSTYDKYAVFRELLEMEQMKEEPKQEEATEEKESEKEEIEQEANNESASESIASLVNLTVKLPPSTEDLAKKEDAVEEEETNETPIPPTEKEEIVEIDDKKKEKEISVEPVSDSSTKQTVEEEEEKPQEPVEVEEKTDTSEKGSEGNGGSDKVVESNAEETNGSTVMEKTEVKSSTSTSSDKYAALREIMGEPEQPSKKPEEEIISPRQASPVLQPPQTSQPKSLAEVELMSLFSDTLPPPSSPKKSAKDEDSKTVAKDIFEEIKMLNTGTPRPKETPPISEFEDVFRPFGETKPERDDTKDDNNWAKFDTAICGSDRSSCEGPRSIEGTSPWSPDGKDFHRDVPFKGRMHRHSGDSDNESKDEEESEESNGRIRSDRFWCGRPPRFDPRFDVMALDERVYEEPATGDKRDRRERMSRKSRGTPWTKNVAHRPRDPFPWHQDTQWEKEPRRYPHRKMPYKDVEDQYEGHWTYRSNPQRWNCAHDHGYCDEEHKRKMIPWNEENRFGSQESMGYGEDNRWSRRMYERWEEDSRFWGQRGGPPDPEYPMRESYCYCRESRERPHDYSTAWNEKYGPERPGDISPRYNLAVRTRHWPKRPNSANEGRNTDMLYVEPRSKFGSSRSECSDNDSDLYLRSSQRSRSRESYWGSDQEYESWAERPYWSEGPDMKSETLHRKTIARHKARQPAQKNQSSFEDDFAPSVKYVESPAVESLLPVEPRKRPDVVEQKPPPSPSSAARCPKDHVRRDAQREYGKRSSYFEDDLTPTASASSDASDRQRLPSDLKATPEELPCDSKEPHQTIDEFASEDSRRDSFFNGDLRFDDDAFAFKSELEDSVPEHPAATLPLKGSRQGKYAGDGSNNNNEGRGDHYIRTSQSVNIFERENDPFDDDDFFN